jgi:hypothetical protein
MKALLGQKIGPANECLAKCIKCDQPIVFLLPEGPIRGQRAQCVFKHECDSCGQSLYATTCTTGQAILAADCSIVNNQMQFVNPVELEINDAGGLTFSGNKLDATPLVVGRGRDGNMTLLSPEDLGFSQY